MSQDDDALGQPLVNVFSGPEIQIGLLEQILSARGIPYVRAPGVYGYPSVVPQSSIRVPADRAEEAKRALANGPGGSTETSPDERDGSSPPELREALEAARGGDQEWALEQARQYLAEHRDDPNSWAGAAFVHRTVGNQEEAESLLREGVRLHRRSASLRFQLGGILESQGKLDEARQAYARLAEEMPGAPHGFVGLAWVAWKQDQPEEASNHKDAAYERIDPVWQPWTSNLLGAIAFRLGDSDMALALFQEHANWVQTPEIAIVVALLHQRHEEATEEEVEERFEEARRLWSGDDASFEDEVTRINDRWLGEGRPS